MEFQKKYCADQEPTKELITKALWDTLNAGQVIPATATPSCARPTALHVAA